MVSKRGFQNVNYTIGTSVMTDNIKWDKEIQKCIAKDAFRNWVKHQNTRLEMKKHMLDWYATFGFKRSNEYWTIWSEMMKNLR